MEEIELKSWNDFIGQPSLKSRTQTYIKAARVEGTPLPHTLLVGPPGMGKTTLATIIAHELEDEIVSTIMPVKPTWLVQTIHRHRGVLFLDEIHRASKKQQEELLPLISSKPYFQLANGQKVIAPYLTVIGATTVPEEIIPPLYTRFPIKPVFEPYTVEEMLEMVVRKCADAELNLTQETLDMMSTAACGVPRNVVQLVLAARSLKSSTGFDPDGEAILTLCGITRGGLNELHIQYLKTVSNFGGKVGLNTIAAVLRLHPKVIGELERTLLDQNLIMLSPSGRELLSNGYDILQTTNKGK